MAVQARVTGVKVGSCWLRMSSEDRARGSSQCTGCGTQKKESSKASPARPRRDWPGTSPPGPPVWGGFSTFQGGRRGLGCRRLKAYFLRLSSCPPSVNHGVWLGVMGVETTQEGTGEPGGGWGPMAWQLLRSEGQRGVLRLSKPCDLCPLSRAPKGLPASKS